MKKIFLISLLSTFSVACGAENHQNIDPKAKAILAETLKVYQQSTSYQHEAELVFTQSRGENKRTKKRLSKLSVQKPNKIFFQWITVTVISDGKEIQAYYPQMKQYTKSPAPKKLSGENIEDVMQGESLTIILNGLLSDYPLGKVLDGIGSMRYLGETTNDGKKYQKLNFIEGREKGTLLIDAQTKLINRLTVEPANPSRQKWEFVINYKNIKVNKPIDESVFQITIPAGAKKVKSISFTRNDNHASLGKKIPDIELLRLNSKKKGTVHELSGSKVTFVTFWASWCGPCRMELPVLQKLYAKYKDKGFGIVGVNLDRVNSIAQAKITADKLKLTFPILSDPNAELAKAMGVGPIPTLLILDANGKVIEAHEGFHPYGEKEFVRIIQEKTAAKK